MAFFYEDHPHGLLILSFASASPFPDLSLFLDQAEAGTIESSAKVRTAVAWKVKFLSDTTPLQALQAG
jgi:hypothetical protein